MVVENSIAAGATVKLIVSDVLYGALARYRLTQLAKGFEGYDERDYLELLDQLLLRWQSDAAELGVDILEAMELLEGLAHGDLWQGHQTIRIRAVFDNERQSDEYFDEERFAIDNLALDAFCDWVIARYLETLTAHAGHTSEWWSGFFERERQLKSAGEFTSGDKLKAIRSFLIGQEILSGEADDLTLLNGDDDEEPDSYLKKSAHQVFFGSVTGIGTTFEIMMYIWLIVVYISLIYMNGH